MNLTYHGKTKDACEWVIEKYKNYKLYSDNTTVQQWVKDSEEMLNELKQD